MKACVIGLYINC